MPKPTQPAAALPPAGAGARLLASLPAKYRPSEQTIARLAPKVDLLISAGQAPAELVRRLTAGIDSAHDPGAALVQRLEKLPPPKGVQLPEKPPWCGECDQRTRMREKPDTGLPYRCPDCHPRCVGETPAAS
jgi:hypothetical protein